jgi:hypothetical protein
LPGPKLPGCGPWYDIAGLGCYEVNVIVGMGRCDDSYGLTTPPEPGVLQRGEYPQLVSAITGLMLEPQLFLKVTKEIAMERR